MTLENIINKAQKRDTIQFTTRANRYSPEKNLIVLEVLGDKVMSKEETGKVQFNRLDYQPLRYVINPLPF